MACQRIGDCDRNVLLQSRAKVLHQCGRENRTFPARQSFRHGHRHCAQHRQVRDDASRKFDRPGINRVMSAQVIEPDIEQRDAGIKTLRPAALEREFGVDLIPASALMSDERVFAQTNIVEEHFIEIRLACEVSNLANGDAGQR